MADFANALAGFGAGLSGQLPQFMQQQQNAKVQNEAMAAQKQQQIQLDAAERMKTYFLDADAALKMANAGKFDSVVNLGLQRLQLLKNFPDADPSDTQMITQLATAAKNGSKQAAELLKGELETAVELGKSYGVIQAPKVEEFTLSPGQQRFRGDQVVASVAPESTTGTGFTLSGGQTRYDAQGNPIVSAPALPEKPVEPKTFQEASEIRKEFSAIPVVRDFAQQSTAMGRIEASAGDPSPAGDLAMIFNYMKVLDPGSTVREGEFANAQNAGAVDDRVVGLYNRVINGTRLTEDQRADFLNRGKRLYQNAEGGFMRTYDQYKRIAERRQIPLEDALIDFRYKFADQAPAATGVPTVSSQAQFDALPSGTEYMEDGVKYRKP